MLDSEKNGSIVVKPTIVETLLLASSGATLMNHGLKKYRDSLEACFEEAELREYIENTCCTDETGENLILKSRNQEMPNWVFER
jgi:hypothetical protein